MDPELIKLSQKIVASQSFVWMPGMKFFKIDDPTYKGRFLGEEDFVGIQTSAEKGNLSPEAPVRSNIWGWINKDVLAPDLSDEATIGCLISIIKDASGDVNATICYKAGRGWFADVNGIKIGSGSNSRVEAISSIFEII